jgi:transcriptional regulator with XRE-family HTH domain
MEKQANRGASALMMPASDTRSRILEESIKAQETIRKNMGRPSRHLGELYEEVGKQLSKKLGVPHFRIRARFIQLGYVEAKGSLNYVEKKLIQPFAFEPDSWQEPTHTFNIDRRTLQNLMIANEDLRKVMESKRYVYADGHVVRNGSRFLELKKDWMGLDNLVLSDWANRHVDECCLRFVRVYMQEGIGQYVFGRMYYDAEFVARTRFYIDDFLNREKIGDIDDIEARMLYKQRFPKKFAEAFQFLRVANGTKMIEMADALGLTEQQLRRWLDMPTKYRNEDFLTAVALVLELPDWISRLLFKRAGLVLDDENARHVALDHILRAQSCDGIPAANSYLERHNLSALTY